MKKGRSAINPLTVPDVETSFPALYDALLRRTSFIVIGISDEGTEAKVGTMLGNADGDACKSLLIDCTVSARLAAFGFATMTNIREAVFNSVGQKKAIPLTRKADMTNNVVNKSIYEMIASVAKVYDVTTRRGLGFSLTGRFRLP